MHVLVLGTYRETALKFGSQFKMMKVLHELWDPSPDVEAQGSGWFGLKHLGHHKTMHDKRLSGKICIFFSFLSASLYTCLLVPCGYSYY